MAIGVLDDDLSICRFLEAALSIAGYKVYAYTDPEEFVSAVYPHKMDYFTCIIVDFHLPGKYSGADVIQRVRMDYPSLPAILISADPPPPAILQDLSDIVVYPKPFRLSKLLELLRILQEE